jgi:glutathione peroxidase
MFGETLNMRRGIPLVLALVALVAAGCGGAGTRSASVGDAAPVTAPAPPAGATPVLIGSVQDIDGVEQALSSYTGKVVLVVNTASRCGYTPQYEGLEALYKEYASKGFVVLGFPSNDFRQELANDGAVRTFCSTNYGVTFPLFARTSVIGPDANPLFAALAKEPEEVGAPPGWNFTKYLLNRAGVPVVRWNSNVEPGTPEMTRTIEALLAQQT